MPPPLYFLIVIVIFQILNCLGWIICMKPFPVPTNLHPVCLSVYDANDFPTIPIMPDYCVVPFWRYQWLHLRENINSTAVDTTFILLMSLLSNLIHFFPFRYSWSNSQDRYSPIRVGPADKLLPSTVGSVKSWPCRSNFWVIGITVVISHSSSSFAVKVCPLSDHEWWAFSMPNSNT